MRSERTSVGELVFPHFSKPEWAETKLKHWTWIIFFAGVALLLRGFGVPVEFSADFPFVEWKDGAAADINRTAVTIGLALFLIGLLLSWRIIPKRDEEKDQHWPEVKADYEPKAPVLFMETPTRVDTARLGEKLRDFGANWPPMTIRWPHSSQRLIDEAKEVMEAQHQLDLSDDNARLAFESLQYWIDFASGAKQRCASALPAVIQRCADLPPETISGTIQRLLVLVNYNANKHLFESLTQVKVVAPDIAVPMIWDSLFGKGKSRQTLYGTNDTGILKRAILIGIGNKPAFGPRGSIISVNAPGYAVRHRISPARAGPNLLSEIEAFVMVSGGELPDRYDGDLLFSKIGPSTSAWVDADIDVNVDSDLQALSEKYQKDWADQHPYPYVPRG